MQAATDVNMDALQTVEKSGRPLQRKTNRPLVDSVSDTGSTKRRSKCVLELKERGTPSLLCFYHAFLFVSSGN